VTLPPNPLPLAKDNSDNSIICPSLEGQADPAAAYRKLVQWFSKPELTYVAFSGGVDSALVLHAAVEGAGKSKVKAVTADSASLPRAELEAVEQSVRTLGVEWIVLKTEELDDPLYRANSGDRCYHCKQTLYKALRPISTKPGMVTVDGTNLSDFGDTRPGLRAATEQGVLHPLVECGFDKSLVRAVSRMIGLATADKPASACLSSRIPVGTEVSAEKLARVEAAEAALRSLGFFQVRVRYHEGFSANGKPNFSDLLGRVEFGIEELSRALEPLMTGRIVEAVTSAGFNRVEIDPNGYRSRERTTSALVGLPSAARQRSQGGVV
jgi:uncharacterized protein